MASQTMAGEDLATREQRAQTGVLQFAEEMKAIRDSQPPLYPNAGKKDAWKTYCQDRWGMSKSSVDGTILALPVLQRAMHDGVVHGMPTVSAAATVATLPELVQDAILGDQPKRDLVKARAKAARQVVTKAESKGIEPDVDEMIAVAMKAKPPKKIKTPETPDELKDENLPPKLTPEDHGSAPRKLTGDALLSLWRANEKLQDEALDDDDREATEAKLEKIILLAQAMQGTLRGEGFVTDEDLARLMEGAET